MEAACKDLSSLASPEKIQAAVVNGFSAGPGKVGTLGISRVLSLSSADNRTPLLLLSHFSRVQLCATP